MEMDLLKLWVTTWTIFCLRCGTATCLVKLFSEYGKSIVMPLEHHAVLNSGCCWIRSILLSTSPAYQDFIYVSLLHLKSLCNVCLKPQKFYVDIWWIIFSFLALIPSLCTWHAGTKSLPLWTLTSAFCSL